MCVCVCLLVKIITTHTQKLFGQIPKSPDFC